MCRVRDAVVIGSSVSCFRPLRAHRSEEGEVWIGYDATRDGRAFEVPCGRCIGCKLDRARAWSVRITHEAQLYDRNWFATFTYADDRLPESRSLEYRDFQLFMKRLRKKVQGDRPGPEGNYPLRFFCSGEYGGRTGRPHYHAILFNTRFGDEVRMSNGRSSSRVVEELWSHGSVVLDDVNQATAAYVAGYCLKKVYGARARDHYEDVVNLCTGELTSRRPEFVTMSRRPGIGAWWYQRFAGDLFPEDHAVVDGKRHKVPLYYWKKFREEGEGDVVERIEEKRFARAQEQLVNSTPERRAVREEVAERRQEMFSERGL